MRPTNFHMIFLAAVIVVASATGDCKEYPFEETDPDANGTLGVMTREPHGPVAAGSLASFEVYGPSQYLNVNDESAGWQLPQTQIRRASAEPSETLSVEALEAFQASNPRTAEWVQLEGFEEGIVDQWDTTERLLVRAGRAGTGLLSVAAEVEHNRDTHRVEDVFEIPVKSVERLDILLRPFSRGAGSVLVGQPFELSYMGYADSIPLHGLGYFDATIEPAEALTVDDVTWSDILAGQTTVAHLSNPPVVAAVASQPGTLTISPQPAGDPLILEAIEPSSINRLGLERLHDGQSLRLGTRSPKYVTILASVDEKVLYTRHQNLLDYEIEVLDVAGGAEVCLVAQSGQDRPPQSRVVLDENDDHHQFVVAPQSPGQCEIRITHLLADATPGTSIVLSVEVIE